MQHYPHIAFSILLTQTIILDLEDYRGLAANTVCPLSLKPPWS